MTKVSTGIELVKTLTDDELNQLVDFIRDEYKLRRARLASETRAQLVIGESKVRLKGLKPAYLNGLTGVAIERKNTRIRVKLDRGPTKKFREGFVTVNASALEVL